jgi:pimeloyl-ACP methyl ester carboxylesterase
MGIATPYPDADRLGQDDTWVPIQRGQGLHAEMQQSEWVVLPEAGHLPMEEQAEAFKTCQCWPYIRRG